MRIAFDLIGSRKKAVAIVQSDKKEIAQEIMKRYPHVKSVLVKVSPRRGVLRVYKLKLLAGSRNTEVIHKEHGMLFKLDPRYVYFSPREATERQRIAKIVKPRERVLVMFAGVAPFAIAIARAQPSTHIVCIEINPKAVKYARENIQLNKTWNIEVYQDDAAHAPKYGKFDRIIMPLPERAIEYLSAALKAAKPGAIIHLYAIGKLSELKEKIRNIAQVKLLRIQKVLPYAPRLYKLRADLKVNY